MSQALLNIEEAVHQYPYWKPRTLRSFVKEGTLPCYRLGKRLYFRPSDLETFIESIPFAETREYVKIVLGNYAAYRSLYPPVNAKAASGK